MNRRQPGTIILGSGLLLTGGWLVASGFGVPLAGLERIWPALLVLASLALLAESFQNSGASKLGAQAMGAAGLLSGLFLSAFTLELGGLSWPVMINWWPVFLIIAAAAIIFVYICEGPGETPILIPAYLIGGLGLFALIITLGVARSRTFAEAIKLWPLLAVMAGAVLYARLTGYRPSAAPSDRDTTG
jgi:hypothetical protein